MRRLAIVLLTVLGALSISSPAWAVAHDRVANPYLHTALDVLTFALVASPLLTAWFWGKERRLLMLGLMAIVQIPAAFFAFVPIKDPVLHIAGMLAVLTVTGSSLLYVRATTKAKAAESAVPEQR